MSEDAATGLLEILSGAPWWIKIVAFMGPGAVAFWYGRFDKNRAAKLEKKREEAQAEIRKAEIENSERAQLSKEQAGFFDRLRKERDDLQAQLTIMRDDRDRGWNVARGWESMAHNLQYRLGNSIQSLNNYREKEGLVPLGMLLDLPDLEDIQTRPIKPPVEKPHK